MFENLRQLLRKRHEIIEDASSSASESNPAPDNVTLLTPNPLQPRIAEMSDLAEAAVDELTDTLSEWFETDLQTLLSAWQRLEEAPYEVSAHKEVFRAAHNLSGMSETYDQPEVGRLCKSLCKLLERDSMRDDRSLASLHIDACRAVRTASSDRSDAKSICDTLEAEVNKLRAA